MIDPTLAALLADPEPDARLIAADRAADVGEDMLEAMLRLDDDGCGWIGGDERSAPYGFGFSRSGVEIWERPSGLSRWQWRHSWGWREYLCTGTLFPGTPPPGLEAAVLAVLRRRLAEVQHG